MNCPAFSAGGFQYIFNSYGLPGDYIFATGIRENGSTCAQLATTVDIMKRAASGDLYHYNGTPAGESGWIGCESNTTN